MIVFRRVIVKLKRVSRTGEVREIFLGEIRVIVVDKTCVDKAPRPGEEVASDLKIALLKVFLPEKVLKRVLFKVPLKGVSY